MQGGGRDEGAEGRWEVSGWNAEKVGKKWEKRCCEDCGLSSGGELINGDLRKNNFILAKFAVWVKLLLQLPEKKAGRC